MKKMNPFAENMSTACMLSIVGGFLDIYTYIFRGGVFANAVTGNMVIFAWNITEGAYAMCGKYFLAICCYALGIFCAEYIHQKLPPTHKIQWHQITILLEIVCLIPLGFIPPGPFDFIINASIAFVCALQVQTFRSVHGLPFASTMCTGNLRNGTEALFHHTVLKDASQMIKVFRYYGIIACFILGAVIGGLLLTHLGSWMFFFAPTMLIIILFKISTLRQRVWARRLILKK